PLPSSSLFHSPPPPRDLHSFPTRRSSDLRWYSSAITAPERPPRIPSSTIRAVSRLRTASPWRADCRLASSSEAAPRTAVRRRTRSEEHTSELQSPDHLVCRLLLEKKNTEQ